MNKRQMSFRLWAIALIAAVCLGPTGCVPQRTAGNTAAQVPAAAVNTPLPSDIAGPPETLSMLRRIPTPTPLEVRMHGNDWWIIANTPWRGRIVTVYYVPQENVLQDGDHYDLRSAVGLQRIATAEVRPDGTWTAIWSTRGLVRPTHPGVFLLARSDQGELGLGHVSATR
jgi:hypothetical protein